MASPLQQRRLALLVAQMWLGLVGGATAGEPRSGGAALRGAAAANRSALVASPSALAANWSALTANPSALASDNVNCDNGQGGNCDFSIVLNVDDGAGGKQPYYGYQYGYLDDQASAPYPCPEARAKSTGCFYDWVPQSYKWIYENDWADVNEHRFQYIESAQFLLNEAVGASDIVIHDTKPGTGYQCVRVFQGERHLGDFAMGPPGTGSAIPISAVAADSPVELTAIPFRIAAGAACSDGPSCGDAAGCVDPQRALVVFLSRYSPGAPQPDMVINADTTCQDGVGTDAGYRYGCWSEKGGDKCQNNPCAIDYPYFEVVASDTTPGKDYLVYKGSLVDYQQRYFESRCQGGVCPDMVLKVEEKIDVQLPVNNMVVRAEVASGTCSISADRFSVSGCTVKNFEVLTLAYPGKISIYGYGRVDNYARWRDGVALADFWHDLDTSSEQSMDDKQVQDAMKYMLYSGSLVLSSSRPAGDASDPAIDVSGITVAWGPKRYAGPMQLNAIYTSALGSLGGDCCVDNSGSVRVFDVKVIGNWKDGADCMEVMGLNSAIDSVFCHTNDDSIKLIADGLRVTRAVVFQGNTGSAISLGGYGKNRGTASTVQGVHVHRVTQNTLNGYCSNGWEPDGSCTCCGINDDSNSYDGYGGLVSSRTCPQAAYQGGTTGLMNIDIEDLTVMGLGWVGADPTNGGLAGPNSVTAMISFGILANGAGGFCQGATLAQNFPVAQNTFKRWAVNTNPVWPNLIYNIPCRGAGDCGSTDWRQQNGDQSEYALYTGKAVNGAPLDDGVVVYPWGEPKELAYWVCAVDRKDKAGSCWQSKGQLGSAYQGGAKNTNYDGDVGNAIVFPY